jgi:hypothetical protein
MDYSSVKSSVKRIILNTLKSGFCLLLIFITTTLHVKAQNHLLLSEIVLTPTAGEFIEIFNPTEDEIDLTNYYLADNQKYADLPSGVPTMDIGDFITRFPSGAKIQSGQTLVVGNNGTDFNTQYAKNADFEIAQADGPTPDMILIAHSTPGLSNGGEGIVLFYWDGAASTVKDVDLINAGTPSAASLILNKTGKTGYLADAYTMPTAQAGGDPVSGYSTKRIKNEGQYEVHSNGNGIDGDDETSENTAQTWDVTYTAPNPGITSLTLSVPNRPIAETTIKGYPNPFNQILKIDFIEGSQYYLTDLTGRILNITFDVSIGGFKTTSLNSGVYILHEERDFRHSTAKVIKL